jgi:hypothetical protein
MWVTEIGAEYPNVDLTQVYVDNATMQLIPYPKQVNSLVPLNHFCGSQSVSQSEKMIEFCLLKHSCHVDFGFAGN